MGEYILLYVTNSVYHILYEYIIEKMSFQHSNLIILNDWKAVSLGGFPRWVPARKHNELPSIASKNIIGYTSSNR